MGETLTFLTKLDPTGFLKGSQKLTGAIRSLNNRVNQIGRNTQRMASQMASPLKRLLPTILGVGSAYGIISKAVNAFMQQNEELSQRMSSIWTALGNLLGPIITQIIDWVTTAISYFLSFLKLLGVTGKSASELSKSASKSASQLKKTLAGFDELNVLNDNSGNGDKDKAGLKDIEPSEWMKKLSELLKNKMWDDAADMIIEKMNNLIATIRDKAYELGQAIGEYVGGAFHILARIINEVDWKGIGASIALFLNGLLKAINDIDPQALGAILVGKFTILFRILTGFLENISGPELAKTFNGIIIGALNSIKDAIADADFQKIGNNIREFFKNIDWEGIKNAVFDLLKEAWNGAWDLLMGLLGKGTDDESPLVQDLENLRTSVTEFFEDVASFVEEYLPVITGALTTIGTLIGGLAIIEKIKALKDAIGPLIESAKLLWGVLAANPIIAVIAIIAGLIAAFITAYNTNDEFREKVDNAWQAVRDAISTAIDFINQKIQELKDWWNGMKESFTEGANKISEDINRIKEWFAELGPNIRAAFNDLISSASSWGVDLINNFIGGIQSMASNLWSTVSGIAQGVKDFLGFSEPKKGPLSDFHTYGPDMMELYASSIEKSQNKVLSAVSDVASGVSDALMVGNGMGGIQLPVSAAASGSFLPYNVGSQESMFGASGEDGFISRLSGAIYDAVVSAMSDMQSGSGQRVAVLEVNGREFCRATYYDQQAVAREHGVSLIVNG